MTGELQPDLAAALAAVDPAGATRDDGQFRLLLAHQPAQASADSCAAATAGVDVQLSGHTHAGQLWPMGLAVRLSQPVLDGVHDVCGVQVVTSRGAGAWGPPVRVLADPEVLIVTLDEG